MYGYLNLLDMFQISKAPWQGFWQRTSGNITVEVGEANK
jgi:hypothetical protein